MMTATRASAGTHLYTLDRKGRVVLPQVIPRVVLFTTPDSPGYVFAVEEEAYERVICAREHEGWRMFWRVSEHRTAPHGSGQCQTTRRVQLTPEMRQALGVKRGDTLAVAGTGPVWVICRQDRWQVPLGELARAALAAVRGG